MRSCPRCGARMAEDARACPRCRPTSAPAPKQNLTKAPAWELWVVLLLLAASVGLHLVAGKVLPAVVALLVLLGLVRRATWAFWWAVIANLLGIPLSFFQLQEPHLIAIAVGFNLLIAGLLISCKVREVY